MRGPLLYNEAAARVGESIPEEGSFASSSFFSPLPLHVALNKKRPHIIVDYRDASILLRTFENPIARACLREQWKSIGPAGSILTGCGSVYSEYRVFNETSPSSLRQWIKYLAHWNGGWKKRRRLDRDRRFRTEGNADFHLRARAHIAEDLIICICVHVWYLKYTLVAEAEISIRPGWTMSWTRLTPTHPPFASLWKLQSRVELIAARLARISTLRFENNKDEDKKKRVK